MAKPVRESRVTRMLAAKKAADAGKPGAAGDLVALVRGSTGREVNEAMDRSGQSAGSWAGVR